jgi:hypothetical protein
MPKPHAGLFALSAFLLSLLLASCSGGGHGGGGGGGGGGTQPSLTVTASPAVTVDSGDTVTLTATVLNDASGAGVDWGPFPTGFPTTSYTSTNSTTAVFTPTAACVNANATSLTYPITVTSKTFPTLTKTIDVTASGLPKVTSSGSIAAAREGMAYSTTLQAICGTGALTWSLATGSNPPPAGLTLNSNGTITGTPTGPAGNGQTFQVQVTDSDSPTKHASAAVQLSLDVSNYPLPTFSVGTLPNAAVGVAYNQTVSVVGGHGPYTFTVTGLPAGLGSTQAATSVTISGTPTSAQANVGISVSVSDSSNPTQSNSVTYTIQILSGASACPLVGPFAFLMNGFDTSSRAYAVVGSLTVAQDGSVTGEQDYKSLTATSQIDQNLQVTSGTCTNGSVANSGVIDLTLSDATTRTYAFVLRADGTLGRIAENDAVANLTGVIQAQNPGTFGGFHGDYAFGLGGSDPSGGHFGIAGEFCSSQPNAPASTITKITTDMNHAGLTGLDVVLINPGVTYPAPDSNGRTVLSSALNLTPSSPPGAFHIALLLTFYVVDGGKAFAIDSNVSTNVLGGQVIRQAGIHGCSESYTNASLVPSIFSSWGADNGASSTSIGRVSNVNPTGGTGGQGTASLMLDSNSGGSVTLQNGNGQPLAATYSVDSTGRGTFAYTTGRAHTVHFYLYGSSGDAFFVDEESSAGTGFVRAQIPSSGITPPSGTFAFGTILTPTATATQVIGLLTVSNTALSGQGGASGTITLDNDFASTGHGQATVNVPLFSSTQFVFYVINPNLVVVMGSGSDSGVNDNIGFLVQ